MGFSFYQEGNVLELVLFITIYIILYSVINWVLMGKILKIDRFFFSEKFF